MWRKYLYTPMILLFFLFLLCFPSAAVSSAKKGLQLWFYTVLPTLLPFIICSTVLRKMHLIKPLTIFFSPFTKKIFHLSDNGAYVLLIGFLCGYPMGAKMIGDFVRDHEMSLREAQYLLLFTNNVSPVFVISFFTEDALHTPALLPFFLIVIYGVPLLTGLLLSPFYYREKKLEAWEPTKQPKNSPHVFTWQIIDESICNGIDTITRLGGYMMIFAIFTCIISILPFPESILLWLHSICEITWGIGSVSSSSLALSLKLQMLLPAVCFGGISCIAQTNSMIQGTSLSIWKYTASKIVQYLIAYGIVFFYNFFTI